MGQVLPVADLKWKDTLDGRIPAAVGMYKTPVNNGINLPYQLVRRISSIQSTVGCIPCCPEGGP